MAASTEGEQMDEKDVSILTPERIEDWRKVLDAKYEELCKIGREELRMHIARVHVNELCALAQDGLRYRLQKAPVAK